MLEFLAVLLVVLWLIGAFAVHAAGGFIHLLLVVAIILVIIRVARGDRIV